MMRLSQVARALNAQLVGPDVEFMSVSTDSRKIQTGDLFIALRGEHFDGYAYVAQSLQSGAVAAMVNQDSGFGMRDSESGTEFRASNAGEFCIPNSASSYLVVEDTRLALGQLAAYWRKQFDIPLVAITGSNGKTTVKEMLAAILRQQARENVRPPSLQGRAGAENSDAAVLATQGNFNNDIGMPLTLLQLREQHRYAVIEMGMNHAGEIAYLTRLAQPQVAVVNNASGAHLQGLGSIAAVARAKGEIFAGLDKSGTAVINADDEHAHVWRGLAGTHRVLDFALHHAAAVQGVWTAQGYGGVLQARTPSGELRAVLQVPGEHNARNALAAATAAIALQVPLPVIARGLEGFGGVSGRLQRKHGVRGATLIDDTYNANPASVIAALEVLAQATGQRIFVLGDMGELGDDAAQFHRDIGKVARKAGIEQLFALGELSTGAVEEFGAGARHFSDIETLCPALDKELDAQTTVLVKGSRFMKMERVVQFCAAQKEKACCSH
jgi:UDP-N-acetylmuramoyl-tripeptide--D-alanyl-D-alanine ligase